MFEGLGEVVDRFAGRRVLVVGDLMVDEQIWGSATRVSPEAPVLVIDVEDESAVPGGAANTANQLIAFGATVFVAGAVGDDAAGERLRVALAENGADVSAVVTAADRPTTCKTRVLARSYQGAQQVVRIDREQRRALPDDAERVLRRRTLALLDSCDALLLSDYLKGVLSKKTVAALIEAAQQREIPIAANPKPASIARYRGVDIAQLNRKEADEASRSHLFESLDEAVFHEAGQRLRTQLGLGNLLVTRGSRGLTLFSEGRHFDVEPHAVEVFDGTGAGDSTIAGVTMGLAVGATMEQAVALGNAAGGAVVRRVGVVTASIEDLKSLLAGN